MIIPEVILFNTASKFLKMITDDFTASPSEECTILYNIFKLDDNDDELFYSNFNWYQQAKDLLLRTSKSVRRLELNIGYNLQRAAVPSIHILLPTETKGRFDSIGQSESVPFQKPAVACEDKLWVSKETSHSSVYHLMITSDNSSEVLIVYYFLKYMFTVLNDHLGLKGLLNLSASGQDVNIQQDLASPHIFHRNFSIQFDYANKVVMPFYGSLVNGLSFSICDDFKLDNDEYWKNH